MLSHGCPYQEDFAQAEKGPCIAAAGSEKLTCTRLRSWLAGWCAVWMCSSTQQLAGPPPASQQPSRVSQPPCDSHKPCLPPAWLWRRTLTHPGAPAHSAKLLPKESVLHAWPSCPFDVCIYSALMRHIQNCGRPCTPR